MATRQIRKTDLVGVSSVSFIRAQRLEFSVTGTKPNTRMHAFFDNVLVDQYVNGGAALMTDASGNVSGYFDIPPLTFQTGERTFLVLDGTDISLANVAGNTVGIASAVFTTNGIKNTYQETVTDIKTVDQVNVVNEVITQRETKTINTVNYVRVNVYEPVPPQNIMFGGNDIGGRDGLGDPLAQSFFTYGVEDGCFITAIGLYFQSKDSNIPVTVEIRELINGYPGPRRANRGAVKTLQPTSVLTSSTASLETKFIFDRPVYLGENKDWCFVVSSNSNNYNVWTSKIGEFTKENPTLKMFEQPFVGSMFKSENNITWTTDQTEDVKFTLYKANFNTSVTTEVKFLAEANTNLLYGSKMYATSGSPSIRVKFDHQHGLRTNDYITITPQSSSFYRGISSANLTGDFQVIVIDDYELRFSALSSATSTGTLTASGKLNAILIDTPGAGYSTPVITISGGGGSGATATATVGTSGEITSVTITNAGTGYTSTPIVSITNGAGPAPTVTAILTAVSESIFAIQANTRIHSYAPVIYNEVFPSTEVKSFVKTTNTDYVANTLKISDLNEYTQADTASILISNKNKNMFMAGTDPTEIKIEMSTNNSNVSPVILLDERPSLKTLSYVINNQTSIEDLDAKSDSVRGIVVTNPGVGYDSVPTVTISAPDSALGVQATAVATVSNNAISLITITNPGSGYVNVPTVSFSGGTPETVAEAVAIKTSAGSASINTINVTAAGSGYTVAPTVNISVPNVSTGTQAVATATISGGQVVGIVISNPGSGYTTQPTVTLTGGNGNGAAAAAVLTPFNTELMPYYGTAKAKYFTKPNKLETLSKAAKVIVNAMSRSETAIDVYLRTSLSSSGLIHTNLDWVKMNCDTETNLSKTDSDFIDYTFYLDDIDLFDIYDIKIVMRSTNRMVVPIIENYRATMLAT